MKRFTVAIALGSAVLLGGSLANSARAGVILGSSQASEFSSQHHGGGHRVQRIVRPSHHAPRHVQRRVHGGGHEGGHGGNSGITIGIGGGGGHGGRGMDHR